MIKFPLIDSVSQSREMVTQFLGLNHNNSVSEGEFYDMKNISADEYPFLSTRKKRYHGLVINNCQALATMDDDLYWISDKLVYKNNVQYTRLPSQSGTLPDVPVTDGKQQIVKIGNKICLFPTKCFINTKETAKYKSENLERTFPEGDFAPVNYELNLCNEKMKPISSSKVKDESYFSWLTDESETLSLKADLNNAKTVTVKETISESDKALLVKIRVKDTAGNYYVIDSATVGTNGSATITLEENATIKKNAVLHLVGYRRQPKNGQYMLSRNDEGQAYLQRYNITTDLWTSLQKTYFQIKAPYIANWFHEGDAVTIQLKAEGKPSNVTVPQFFQNLYGQGGSYLFEYIFMENEDKDDTYENTFIIAKKKTGQSGYIIVPGILDKYYSITPGATQFVSVQVRRETPDMDFVIECGNRLWGCSSTNHEIYCSKLGDPKNWKNYEGLSTDAWAATVGSEGKFTGAVNYLGMPIFFKENSMIKVSTSQTGAHSYKEYPCRGVKDGASDSLCLINERLYYIGVDSICMYDGSFPVEIGQPLGMGCRYTGGIGGKMKNKYMVSLFNRGESTMYSYDTQKGLWCKEDNFKPSYMVYQENNLLALESSTNKLYSFNNDKVVYYPNEESDFEWYAESGDIGYSSPDKKYISRLSLRMELAMNTECKLYIQYDSCGRWDFVCDLGGKGTKTFTVPVHPRRCDHFRYKLIGKGEMKLISMTKTITEGSDV